jgi:hypothetical protein
MMGGLIALFLFFGSLTIALYYLFRKLVVRREIPSEVSRDDVIRGALNITVFLGSIFLFVYLLKPFFLDAALPRGVSATFRRLLLFGTSFGLSYLVLLVVDHVFTGGQKT